MDRLRRTVLARTGLAGQQHRRAGLRRARHPRESGAHHRRLADQRAESITREELEADRFADELEPQSIAADLDLGATPQIADHDAHALDASAVRRAEITDHRTTLAELDLAVK